MSLLPLFLPLFSPTLDVLRTYYPRLAGDLAHQHQLLTDHTPHHTPFWAHCPWSATTLNINPQVVTKIHRDSGNISYGLCAVAVFGGFDHTKGGHLVFDDLKLIVEMKHGDVVLFPSALLLHWNTPIRPHEKRRSIVWWACGQTIRYHDMNGVLLNTYDKDAKKIIKAKQAEEARKRLRDLIVPFEDL